MSVSIVVEVGSVHDGSFGNALCLVDLVSQLQADSIKFQTHIADAETLPTAPSPSYFKNESRIDYFHRTGFSFDQWRQIKQHCTEKNIEFISSPFSIEAVELLENVGINTYKIPSGEITNIPMIETIAQTKKPIIMSSGMSSWEELDLAVNACLRQHSDLTLLQCTSKYPCPYDDVGLNVMLEMKDRYRLPVGLSDHTLTTYASIAAVSLGAVVIEKHLTFSRYMYGSDARHSLEPSEMAELIKAIRAITVMLESPVDKNQMAHQLQDMKKIFEKSIVSTENIKRGSIINEHMISLKKPGYGIPSYHLSRVIGKAARRDIPKDHIIEIDDILDF